MKKKNKAYLYLMIIGIVLVVIGVFAQVPGGALTTYETLDGDLTDGYAFDNKYSTIDEYVGGDAYNYIIGATLVSGKIAGMMIVKAIFIASGLMSMGFGLTLKTLFKKEFIALTETSGKDLNIQNEKSECAISTEVAE